MPTGPMPKAPISASPISRPPSVGELAAAIRMYQAKDYEGALLKANQLAQRNDANAMSLAGFIHENGLVKAANIESAAQFYRRAVQLNNEDAMLGLARLYERGQSGVTLIEARTALEKAYSLGRKEAGISLANILFFDEVNPDKSRAYSIYKTEADSGNKEAAYLCALYLLEQEQQTEDTTKATGKYLEIAANGNIPQAQSLFGVYNYLGTGGDKNLEVAAAWFQKAAQNNDADGMFYWALVNAKGEGVPRNLEIAHEFAAKAKNIKGENQASADRLWQQLEQIRARQAATNNQATKPLAQSAPSAATPKAAKRRKRR